MRAPETRPGAQAGPAAGTRWPPPRRSDDGFTLIELLVVVVVIGILIAIAVPLYLSYQKNANDATTKSDLRNAIPVVEQCYSDNGKYPVQSAAAVSLLTVVTPTGTPPTLCAGTYKTSSKSTVSYLSNSTGTAYVLSSTSTAGSGTVYCFFSGDAGTLKKEASGWTPTAVASC